MFGYINSRFGSKKGFANQLKYQFCQIIGKYNPYTNIDFSKIDRFVFVCSGNICRSPLADIVMRKTGGNSMSFGLEARGGDNADPRMILFGTMNGFDLSTHVSQPISQYVPLVCDLLIGMEPSHLIKLHSLFPNNQITSLGLWLPRKKIYIHDPFSTNKVYFTLCAKKIVFATKNLYNIYKSKTLSNN
jgi:protein-tyrosine phosphatase